MTRARPPVVVVGGGVAGLTTALALAPTPVRLLCRAHDGSGTASALAQGGIAAALDPSDSPAMHALDTLTAGRTTIMLRWCSGFARRHRRPSAGCRRRALHSTEMRTDICTLAAKADILPHGSCMQAVMPVVWR